MTYRNLGRLAIGGAVGTALLISAAGCGGGPMSQEERTNTKAGKINQYSSMLGPDASGKPRTELPTQFRRGSGGGAPQHP